jgi:uncharacterized membrane protein YhaH (DUF805 family)
VFFIEAISTATEGLVEKYKARFDPDPQSDGYIFYKDDYGSGVKCSNEQYEAYVGEFEAFVIKSNHFMWWWLLAVVMVYAVVLGYFGIVLGRDEIFEDDGKIVQYVAMVLLLLPLVAFLVKGATLYQKPAQELGGNEIGRERHSKEQIIDRRLRGAPWKIPIFGILISSLGLYFDVENVSGGYDSPYMRYFFIVAIVGFLWFGMRKFRAHGRAARK